MINSRSDAAEPRRDLSPSSSRALDAAQDKEDEWPIYDLAPCGPQRGVLVVLTSGRSRSICDRTLDSALLRGVAKNMSGNGIRILSPTLPLREDRLARDDAGLIRLRTVIAAAAIRRLGQISEPIILLGLSLGAQSALELAEQSDAGAMISGLVLVSGVIEKPSVPTGSIRFVDLIYGSRDHIAYVAPGAAAIDRAIPPGEYSVASSAHLVLGPGQSAEVRVLPNLGHVLDALQADGARDLELGIKMLSERLTERFDDLTSI